MPSHGSVREIVRDKGIGGADGLSYKITDPLSVSREGLRMVNETIGYALASIGAVVGCWAFPRPPGLKAYSKRSKTVKMYDHFLEDNAVLAANASKLLLKSGEFVFRHGH